ncbi:hypothetical protein SDRG_10482 [Saprolegnia diclina VS20]|uniref:Apple domain-containing protein n=1 Tax=Saprolegnia diclina (strain VS20) TaxID=1156394 RepID=T0RI62_SAPDV|nr:hypothetical protein SDRG_10482 [Saprolegnia diclina VS20]EQC31968.1 hypothetical protein SDRG_10482 [Saprolegnia diclina VS20]|eukprot:XP_008614696.1 hypothetical protein SDRG_10482 [Saprolegnia diclina VS20]
MHTSVFAGVLALALQAATALPTCAPIEANVDYWGNDIGRTARTSADDCCADCKNLPGCRLFAWNSHEGGTCWLKSEQRAKASVINDITCLTSARRSKSTSTTEATTAAPEGSVAGVVGSVVARV